MTSCKKALSPMELAFLTSAFPKPPLQLPLHNIMDEIIDKRFERVEKALATLITSISTYNPAPALANDLVAADRELSQGLEQCELFPKLCQSHTNLQHSINASIKLLQNPCPARNLQRTRRPNPRNAQPPDKNTQRTHRNAINQLSKQHKPSLLLRAPLLRSPNQQIHLASQPQRTRDANRASRWRDQYAKGEQIRNANKRLQHSSSSDKRH